MRLLAPLQAFLARLPAGVTTGLACALFIWLLNDSGPLHGVERASLDAAFRARPTRDADPNIVVLVADDATIVRAKRKYGRGWPLPRALYGEAVRRLHTAGAKIVAFDVLFADPAPFKSGDDALAAACREAGNVVQAGAFQIGRDAGQELPASVEAGSLRPEFALKDGGDAGERAIWAAAPLPELAASARAFGHVNAFPESDGTLRRVLHVLHYRTALYPSLSLAAVGAFWGAAPQQIEVKNHQVRLQNRVIPLDENGESLINWVGLSQAHPTFSLNQFLDGDVPDAAVKGRLVLIGVTALGAFEHRATPFSGGQPMVEFQANAMDDLLSGRMLQEVPLFWQIVFGLFFPVACGLIAGRRVVWSAAWAGLMGGVFWASSVGFLTLNWYFPVGPTLLAGAVAFALTTALGFRREWDANARADAALATLARGATLMSAGRDQERLLAVIRATARESLGAREIFLVLESPGHEPGTALEKLAHQVAQSGHTLLYPVVALPVDAKNRRRAKNEAATFDKNQNALLESVATLASGQPTLLAAPLPRSLVGVHNEHLEVSERSLGARKFGGALLAVGRRGGGTFSLREAVLLEALAEQASLALENFHYGEMLRGRIELANSELSDAYRLLSEQSAKLFAAVESIDAALVVCDQNGLAAFVNPAGTQVLQSATPILGESVAAAFINGDLPELATLFHDLETDNEKTRLETTRGQNILTAQFTRLSDENGQFLGAMMVVADVTVQRELDRMKTDFVGFVAHELRTPLTAILGYASLVEQGAGKFQPEQMKEMAGVIMRHCRRLNRMISDLLDVSRIETGAELPIQKNRFDLAALCTRLIVEQRAYLNPRPPIEISFQCSEQTFLVSADSDRMEQVVINLLTNAVKYSPDGGDITIFLGRSTHEICLEVRDQGMGMSREQLEKLFGKFYRTEDARARGIKGTGLGLNLVKQLVEAHKGHLEVESERGKGSTFRVILPD